MSEETIKDDSAFKEMALSALDLFVKENEKELENMYIDFGNLVLDEKLPRVFLAIHRSLMTVTNSNAADPLKGAWLLSMRGASLSEADLDKQDRAVG